MSSQFTVTCLIALALVPLVQGTAVGAKAKTKAKAKAKDPWDDPDASEELEPSGSAGGMSGMSPEDQAGIINQFAARSAARQANSQHAVMKQFMRNFARNMRLSVLADSQGDMPEAERQRLIAKAEMENQAENDDGGGPEAGYGGAGAPEDYAEEMPVRRPARKRLHMLNMEDVRPPPRRHRLLPEAEGIGFPAPPGMAESPSAEEASDAPMYEPAQRRPRRHHLRMLNARRGQLSKVHNRARHEELPPGVVRDDMGRAMPLLFKGGSAARGGAFHATPVWSTSFMCCLLLVGPLHRLG